MLGSCTFVTGIVYAHRVLEPQRPLLEPAKMLRVIALLLYFASFVIAENLHVHIVAHSHEDPGLRLILKLHLSLTPHTTGWLKTMEGLFFFLSIKETFHDTCDLWHRVLC